MEYEYLEVVTEDWKQRDFNGNRLETTYRLVNGAENLAAFTIRECTACDANVYGTVGTTRYLLYELEGPMILASTVFGEAALPGFLDALGELHEGENWRNPPEVRYYDGAATAT